MTLPEWREDPTALTPLIRPRPLPLPPTDITPKLPPAIWQECPFTLSTYLSHNYQPRTRVSKAQGTHTAHKDSTGLHANSGPVSVIPVPTAPPPP
jgi:hypothetical protein